MSLITFVKINNISNLSEARYSAGMGVNQIGICVKPDDENYIGSDIAKDLIQWISGPEIVLECENYTNWLAMSGKYEYSVIQIPYSEYSQFNNKDIKLILEISFDALVHLSPSIMEDSRIEYLYVSMDREEIENHIEVIRTKSNELPLVIGLGVNPENILSLINTTKIRGVALDGKKEIKPGLTDYDHLADVLELIDE